MKTLLEIAKETKIHKGKSSKIYTMQDLELVEAWMRDEIGSTQICKARNMSTASGAYLYYCASVLKQFYKKGKVMIK